MASVIEKRPPGAPRAADNPENTERVLLSVEQSEKINFVTCCYNKFVRGSSKACASFTNFSSLQAGRLTGINGSEKMNRVTFGVYRIEVTNRRSRK